MPYCTDTSQTLSEQILALDIGQVCYEESLKHHNTWRIGGKAKVLVQPENIHQLSNILEFVHNAGLNHITIGSGSNLLFSDTGFDGVVIKMGSLMSQYRVDADMITAGVGISVPRLARLAQQAGLSGLEHAIGIPGTLGGLVAMNGGSLGHSIGDYVRTVRCVNTRGNQIELNQCDCDFSYRHSVFLDNDLTIAEVDLELQNKSPRAIFIEMLDILRQRKRKFPRRQPNCGSVFKRNDKLYKTFGPPGKVIEDLGLKGVSVGDAQISHKHANFIINTGSTMACDVLELIQLIRQRVFEVTNIWLECEVRYVDSDGNSRPAHMQP